MKWLKKSWSYEQCRALGDFMVNVILCDEGRAMYFSGFNFTTGVYEKIHISYVYNEVVYQEEHVRHTTYKLTEDGYNLLLSTLEIENNMKLTIQEMIFKLHLEKASYDKAADDIRNIFHRLRIQLQKIPGSHASHPAECAALYSCRLQDSVGGKSQCHRAEQTTV